MYRFHFLLQQTGWTICLIQHTLAGLLSKVACWTFKEDHIYIFFLLSAWLRGMYCHFVIFASVVVTSLKICASEGDCGETKSSVMHYALLEHAYKRSVVQEYPVCIKSCMKDPNCKSCNYHLTTQQCELNNKTREMAPDKYVRKDYSIYTEMLNLWNFTAQERWKDSKNVSSSTKHGDRLGTNDALSIKSAFKCIFPVLIIMQLIMQYSEFRVSYEYYSSLKIHTHTKKNNRSAVLLTKIKFIRRGTKLSKKIIIRTCILRLLVCLFNR